MSIEIWEGPEGPRSPYLYIGRPKTWWRSHSVKNSMNTAYDNILEIHKIITQPGADPGINFGGGQTKIPNRKLRAKPESRARSARVLRAKPESRALRARELRAKPEPRAKPEKKRGEGSGEGARWAPPQKVFEKSNLKPFILVHIWSNYLKRLTK